MADVNLALPGHPLDSALQVARITNGMYEGKEYVVEEASWRLAPAPVPDGEEEDMAFSVATSHPILVLYNVFKNRWMLSHELPPNKPVAHCWFQLESRQRVVLDPAMWTWPCSTRRLPAATDSAEGRSLFNYLLVDIYKGQVLRKFDPQLEALGDRWLLTRSSLLQVCAKLWTRATSPKINGFKWLIFHRSLATADRYREWLDRQGGASCAGCAGAVNTTEHVLVDCMAAQQLWSHFRAGFRRHFNITVQFSPKSLLLGFTESADLVSLTKQQWWETCRAIGLYTLCRSWTGRTFGGQARLSLLAILHITWQHIWERGRDFWSRSPKNFQAQQWQLLGVCSGPPNDLHWHQAAPAWWLQGAHLVGTLQDPVTVVAPAAEGPSDALRNTPLEPGGGGGRS